MASKNAKAIKEWMRTHAAAGSEGVIPEDIIGKIPGADGIGSIAVYNILMKGVKTGEIERKKVGAKFRYSLSSTISSAESINSVQSETAS